MRLLPTFKGVEDTINSRGARTRLEGRELGLGSKRGWSIHRMIEPVFEKGRPDETHCQRGRRREHSFRDMQLPSRSPFVDQASISLVAYSVLSVDDFHIISRRNYKFSNIVNK